MKDSDTKLIYRVFLFIASLGILISVLIFFFNKGSNQTFGDNFSFENNYENNIDESTKLTNFKDFNSSSTSVTTYKTSDYIYFPVSKTTSLGQYAPDDLITLPNQYVTKTTQVSKLIESDLERMLDHARVDGVDIKVTSGYRSYSAQQALFNLYLSQEQKNHPTYTQSQLTEIVNTYSAVPGHSEHQLGTTVDLVSSENGYQLIADDNLNYVKWIAANAAKYNFKISYPKDNPEYIYEPWHLRWWPKS